MKALLERLNYKGQKRIAVLNTDRNLKLAPLREMKEIQIDKEIDARYPYDFMIVFVRTPYDVDEITPAVLHNLKVDGLLWYCFPKKNQKNTEPEIDRYHGWKALNDLDFFGIRLINLNEDWAALRFRNKKFIKSSSSFPGMRKSHGGKPAA